MGQTSDRLGNWSIILSFVWFVRPKYRFRQSPSSQLHTCIQKHYIYRLSYCSHNDVIFTSCVRWVPEKHRWYHNEWHKKTGVKWIFTVSFHIRYNSTSTFRCLFCDEHPRQMVCVLSGHCQITCTWWRHRSPVTGEFPPQRSMTRSFDVFFVLRQNQQLSKQWTRRWFETPSCSLWRHCNEMYEMHSW